MALDIEIRILVENHHHRGMLCHPGDIITVTPDRAQRLIAQGIGEKCGVSERVEEEPEGVDEELSEDDVDEWEYDDEDEDEEVGTAD